MQELTAIVEFKDATIKAVSPQISGLSGASFSLARRDIALVAVEEGREHIPLAPLAQGLLTPDSGKVYFCGECWEDAGPRQQSLMRGRIRRVFEHYGWVSNLDMMENLCLAECHNTDRSMEDIHKEVRNLARRFGVDEIPDARPTRVHQMILRKLEWVRAFMGTPDLIILERPLLGAPKADASRLIAAVCEAAQSGVTVLWISDDTRIFGCRELAGSRRFRMDGDKLLAAKCSRENEL
ncbi:MAG: hypothetical protein WCO42_05805 [bacterium]